MFRLTDGMALHSVRTKVKALKYSLPLVFLATVPLGFVLGGAWSFLTLVVMPLAIAGLDSLLGSNWDSPDAADTASYRLIPWLYIPLQIATTLWAAFAISGSAVTPFEAGGLLLSVGLTAGVFGMLTAHEMVHSRAGAERALGLTMLASVGYVHFRIAHIYGHHVHAAEREDSATARQGESVYRFVLRSVLGQVREAWTFEANRLRRRDDAVCSVSNRMLQYFAIELIILLLMGALGPRALAFFVAQAIIAIFLLELFNYIAHYGLLRQMTSAGSLEKLAERHSWNSSRRMNNWSLINMGRHSDHHRFPSRSYQLLEPLPGGAELPCGYAGAILLALLPPLWRRVMDPRVINLAYETPPAEIASRDS